MFNVNELEESEGQLVHTCVKIQDVFTTMQTMLRLFKTLISFTLVEGLNFRGLGFNFRQVGLRF